MKYLWSRDPATCRLLAGPQWRWQLALELYENPTASERQVDPAVRQAVRFLQYNRELQGRSVDSESRDLFDVRVSLAIERDLDKTSWMQPL